MVKRCCGRAQQRKGEFMIRITQLKLPVEHTPEQLKKKIAKTLKCAEDTFSYEIVRQSLDARHKDDKKFVYTVDVKTAAEQKILRRVHNNNIMSINKKDYQFPLPGTEKLEHVPVIVGSGPAGLFCAWYLARAGYRPLVLERGQEAQKRKETVDRFWKDGVLDPDSNVQFGDVLIGIVETMRHQIEEMGGSFRFETKVTDLCIENGHLTAVEVNNEEKIPADACVLALGHSARDTFDMLHRRGVYMEPKSFAVGLRMEHPQKMINYDLYGEEENEFLGAASYKVTHTCENGRGVYSFCMCPGGYVVNASSEQGMLAVNGMSYQARDSKNANSALIVTVTPEDFPEEGPLGGISFQRELEKRAWEIGKGKIPVQLFGDYKLHQKSSSFGEIEPQMKGAYVLADVRSILPKEIGDSIEEGVLAFGKKLKGFDRNDAILSGVESRTSSPVRIVRNREGYSNIEEIYPCGEGAGYAGGITSAAMDGIKTAEFICEKFRNF